MTTSTSFSSPEEIKKLSVQACEAAEQFVKLFYDVLDKRRHVAAQFYMDTATLTWNGHQVATPAEIVKFLETLPSSEHKVESMDAQPIAGNLIDGQTAILVVSSGVVKYQGNAIQAFNQNFLLVAQNQKWKIVTDCFRATE